MIPSLIGYFPKRVVSRPDWLKAGGVKDICSVSECISAGPENWINQWKHNALWLFDDEATAWGVVPGGKANRDFQMFAYQMFPVRFDDGQEQPFPLPELHVQPLPEGYRRLGYDAVSRSGDTAFECSPLSCNHAAEKVAVNEHCLVDDLAAIFRLAQTFSLKAEGYEPGPYYVVEVWRQELK